MSDDVKIENKEKNKPNFEYMMEESSNHFKEELLQNLELIDQEYDDETTEKGLDKLKRKLEKLKKLPG